MRKALLTGIVLAGLAAAGSFAADDWNLLVMLSGTVSLISISISGLLFGVFTSGEQNRANFHTESKNDRKKRQKIGGCVLLFGLPNMIAVLVYYLVSGGG
ncbi:DUF5316 domain-containing protein [Bacillus infantis]|uniref:DUF5316 domain-containing protein n=1 Tax=Bacillus infantis TaxID=324767 RepID=UPI00101D5EE4|nr:DUF5316 domain-containing protein [Bacillus infantis]MCA1035178.1 DUF5316 domain-containing protein [Bacillus infantis]MCP1158862.1 DUF5316 domain-containing protein [Bacillus infantis]RYI29479.1 hypothetical protein EVU96_10790 [Bacillus infantis]